MKIRLERGCQDPGAAEKLRHQQERLPPSPTLEQWSSAIGRYIISFSMLDLLVQNFLESILPSDAFSRLRDGHFQDRVKRLKDHVARAEHPPKKKKAMAQFFQRLEPARQFRNHIAHGFLRIGLAGDQKTWNHTLSLPKDLDGAVAPQARHLTYQELLVFQNSAEPGLVADLSRNRLLQQLVCT
jgi:hypothetical protein